MTRPERDPGKPGDGEAAADRTTPGADLSELVDELEERAAEQQSDTVDRDKPPTRPDAAADEVPD